MRLLTCIFGLVMILSPLTLLVSCATDDTPVPPSQRYNSQGWNRPESWEGSAGFGALPQSR